MFMKLKKEYFRALTTKKEKTSTQKSDDSGDLNKFYLKTIL